MLIFFAPQLLPSRFEKNGGEGVIIVLYSCTTNTAGTFGGRTVQTSKKEVCSNIETLRLDVGADLLRLLAQFAEKRLCVQP